jgi:thioesterase domain-containing protein
VYGIRSRGLHGSEQLPESVAEMAAEYAAAIRAVLPHGPCIVGGWSLGGLIAAEVARELIATGQDVDRLLLFDTAIPGSEAGEPGQHAGLEYGLDLDLEALGAMSPDEQLPFLFEHARRLGLIDEQAPPDLVDRVLADLRGLFAHHARLCAAHRPQPLSVDAVLFRPEEVPFDIGGPADRGWGEVVQSLELRYVPGHHHSMVAPPHAAVLAARIGEILASVPVA